MELKKEELEKVSGGYDIYADENGRYLKFSGKDKNLKYVGTLTVEPPDFNNNSK